MNLRQWQKELFEFIVTNKNNPVIRERKIIWVEDNKGCTGKSKFQKWLRLGQRDIVARKLRVSSVERLISAVRKLTVDTMYGKYIEAIFDSPLILVVTNEKLDEHISKLSADRWLRFHINYDYSIEFRKDNGDGTLGSLYLKKLLVIK